MKRWVNGHPLKYGFKLIKNSEYFKSSYSRIIKLLFGNMVFAFMVVIPVMVYFLYNLLIYTPRYESVASIAIKDNNSTMNIGGLGGLLGSSMSGNTNPYMLQQYILSFNMLNLLNKEIKLKSIYQNKQIDFISRLSKSANHEKQLSYYLSQVDVTYNEDSQSLDISALGITPQEAYMIVESIILASQDYVNHIDYQLAKQRLEFAQKQVEMAQVKLSDTNTNIMQFQNHNDILDPKSEVGTLAGILAGLQSQLVSSQVQLINMQEYMQSTAPEYQRQQQLILSLQAQIEAQKQKMLGLEGDESSSPKLNEVVNKFEWLRMQAQVAIGEYTAAIAGLETAKSDIIKQKQQVVILQEATMPDYHEYPRLWYDTFTLFIALSILYGVLRMVKTIIDEHRY